MPYRFLLEHQTLTRFLLSQFLILATLLLGWYFLLPKHFASQTAYGFLPFVGAFLLTHFFWSLWEFFLHRYILHAPVFPLLRIFSEKHNAHHGLTAVRKRVENGVMRVENAFPILLDAQRPHSVFPWWALPGFLAVITPILFGLQQLFTALPIFLGGYLAAFVTYVGYEVIHAFEHRSYELWWQPKISHPVWGSWWKTFYAFHLNHHAMPRSNEAISGFLGFPLPDVLFGTYKRTSTLLLHDATVDPSDFETPKGYLIIRTLDRLLGLR